MTFRVVFAPEHLEKPKRPKKLGPMLLRKFVAAAAAVWDELDLLEPRIAYLKA